MKEFIQSIVTHLVDKEDLVSVKEITGETSDILLEVSADKDDVGKIIGKQGNTARAIRTILKAVSKKQGKRYTLNII